MKTKKEELKKELTPEERQELIEEQKYLNQILNKGLAFDVPKLITGFLYKGVKKNRVFIVRKPYLSTMDCLADIYLQMRINDSQINEDYKRERHELVKQNSFLACKSIAVSLLNRPWKIKLFTNLLASYLKARLDSGKLDTISKVIEVMGDYVNFTNSIRSMAGISRTTQPKADQIEVK